MKIVITQRQTVINGITYDCLDPNWYSFLDSHDIIPLPNIGNLDFDADLLIFSGGNSTYVRELTETTCYNIALEKNIPILGICRGAFVLNSVYHGLNTMFEGHRNTTHTVEMEGNTHEVNSHHDMGIYLLGENLDIVAEAEDSIEAFKHHTHNHWGIVWHPERMDNPVLPIELREMLFG